MVVLYGSYLILIIPFAFVAGDSHYMTREEVFAGPRQWGQQARRKATVQYLGALHPKAASIIYTKLVELVTKVALPVIVILSTHIPLAQTCMVASFGLLGFVTSILHPPIVEVAWCIIEQGLQLFTFLCMSCGVLTVVFPGTGYGEYGLIVALVLVVLITYLRVRWHNNKLAAKAAEDQDGSDSTRTLLAEDSKESAESA
jgi:hypothetical protein